MRSWRGVLAYAATAAIVGWATSNVVVALLSGFGGWYALEVAVATHRWNQKRRNGGLLGPRAVPPERIADELRRAGVTTRRYAGQGTLATEPLLVILWGTSSQEVYDQNGRLIATASTEADGTSLRERLVNSRTEFRDLRGTNLGAVRECGWRAKTFKAVSEDGVEIGEIAEQDGSICQDGVRLGEVKPTPGWGSRTVYGIVDENGSVVARITRTEQSMFSNCDVIEFDEPASPLRGMVLAAAATVNHWRAPKGGG